MNGLASIDFLYKPRQSKFSGIKDKIKYIFIESFSTRRVLGNYVSNIKEDIDPNHINIFLSNIHTIKTENKTCSIFSEDEIIISVIGHESLHSAFHQTIPVLNNDEHYTQWTQMKLGQLVLESNRLYL